MTLTDIIALVEEKCDGRSLGIAKHTRWCDTVRKEAARTAYASGFHGLYFLYKEAKVIGGSEAGKGRYELPDDHIDDLSVWYDGTLMVKADAGVMNIVNQGETALAGLPSWVAMRGRSIDLIPSSGIVAGKEIKMFYNALPEEITLATDGQFTDYFMTQWPNLHVFGMAEMALDSVGAYVAAKNFRDRYNEEINRLTMDNRKFWMKGVKVRLQNWDEFVEQQRYLFPQFGNLNRSEETS